MHENKHFGLVKLKFLRTQIQQLEVVKFLGKRWCELDQNPPDFRLNGNLKKTIAIAIRGIMRLMLR